jgi:hypothetical protein
VLWPYVREQGSLKVEAKSSEFRRNADGTMRIVEVDILKTKYRLRGFTMLDPEQATRRATEGLCDTAAALRLRRSISDRT